MVEIVIKPTTNCNLECPYCNVENRSETKIPITIMKDFFSFIAERFSGERITIKWHGGEPLLMGLEFFRSIIEYQNKLPTHFDNTISTNLSLLNTQWLRFLKENNFAIYTSLDGIGSKHDFQRNNSFNTVKQAITDLKSFGIQKISVNTTVTKYNVDTLEEIYDFCSAFQLRWGFNPVIPAGIHKINAENFIVDPIDFSTAIIRIFDKWFQSASPLDIAPFQYVFNYFLRSEQITHNLKPRLSLGPDGNIYACHLLIGNQKYALGKFDNQVTVETFNSLTCSCQRISFQECKNCHFEFLCKTIHCMYFNEVMSSFTNLPNYFCSCWKPIFNHILEQVKHEIQNNLQGKYSA